MADVLEQDPEVPAAPAARDRTGARDVTPPTPPRFGPIVQNPFVVHDPEAAFAHLFSKIGTGQFYAIEPISFGPAYFPGKPLSLDMSVAIAQWGEIQIE